MTNIGYGEAISGPTKRVSHSVSSTTSPLAPDQRPDYPLNWFQTPAAESLVTPPLAETGVAHADPYLWIKRPVNPT